MESTAYFQQCRQLTASGEWQLNQAQPLSHRRAVTWAQWPYRYLLTEYGARERHGVLRRQRLQTKLFELALLSARRQDTGERDYHRYYIFPDNEVFAFVSQLGEPEQAATHQAAARSFDFILENGLYQPNYEQLFDVEQSLAQAHQDGVEPFIR